MNARLREMIEMEKVSGTNILKLQGHHRQQIKYEDDPDLAAKVGMFPGEIRKYEVFTTLLYDGYICDSLFSPDINQLKDIIDQLFSGLGQIIRAGKCHNDLK